MNMSAVWFSGDLSSKVKENELFHENAQNIAKDVTEGILDITSLVESLCGVLTDINPEYRSRGMLLYSKVLSFLPESCLSETQLNAIVTFYVDRLRDNHKVIPSVIEGVLALAKMKNLPKDAAGNFLLAIYQNVPCQQQVRTDRNIIYNIIHTLTLNNTAELKTMGADLVYGVISAMDGERDPRNLMLLFSILPTFLKHMPLGHLVEEMFEVIACYYPVDFNSSPDDPNAITRNDLADKLCVCLCATPDFAQFCLPLLLEKLDSNLRWAKLDSLKLLKQSCGTFSVTHYEPHLQTIWTALKTELSTKADNELLQAAHDALSALVNNLCSDTSRANISESFIKQIIDSMKIVLADAKTKITLELPLRVFLTTANASEKSCVYIIEIVVPLIMVHHHLNLDEKLQVSSFEWFSLMFNSCRNWNVLSKTASHFAQLPKMCLKIMNSSDCDDLKNICFKVLANLAEIIEPDDIPSICDILSYHMNNNHSKLIVDSSQECLLALSKKEPNVYMNFVLDKLNIDLTVDVQYLNKQLDILCSLASISAYTDIIIRKLTSILTIPHSEVGYELIDVLLDNFTNNLFSNDQVRSIQMKFDILKHVLLWAEGIMHLSDLGRLSVISKLIKTIIKTLESHEQYVVISTYTPDYLSKLSVNSAFVILLEAVLNSSKRDVSIICLSDVMSQTAETAFNETDPEIHSKACMLIANILNKYTKNEEVSMQYDKLKRNFGEKTERNMNDTISSNCIMLCSWIAKSLLLCRHADSQFWLGKLIQFLDDEKWGLQSAKCFKLIMTENTEALNSECFCNMNFLFQQKVFHMFMQQTANSEKKESYLLAWVYIIQSVPKAVLQKESAKVSSILIESLNYNDQDLLLVSLSTLSHLIQSKSDTVASSLQTLLPRCVKVASLKNSMDVRMASLQCLYDIASSYPTMLLLPFKDDLLLELAARLDDPKRLVRSVAVKARTRWFLVGSPGEDKLKTQA